MKLESDQNGIDGNVLSAVERWAVVAPQKKAIICGNDELNFSQLRFKTVSYRTMLSNAGVIPGAVVAVSVKRDVELVPILLAIWSLRAAYVPVDPSYPRNWKEYIVEHSGVSIIVCDKENPELADDLVVFRIDIEREGLLDQREFAVEEPLSTVGNEGDLAYIIYTSGSTGKPKGVAVNQGNIRNFLHSVSTRPGLDQNDVMLAITTISFDIHILELFLPVLVGATIVLVTRDESAMQPVLRALIEKHQVTTMQSTPSQLRLLLEGGWEPEVKLKKLLVGGETFPQDILQRLYDCANQVWNMYGPTETTVWSSCCVIERNSSVISIGYPIENTEFYIVDEQLDRIEGFEEGELLIGGKGVAEGYHNSQALTEESFIWRDSLSSSVLYRTGDIVRYNGECYEYIGRKDEQIKVRGFRIESGQIELAIKNLSDKLSQVVVVATKLTEADVRIVAFYSGQEITGNTLREHCLATLPSYMVPQHFFHVDAFPVTNNLKVDRTSLKEEARQRISINNENILNKGPIAEVDDLELSLLAVWEKVLGVSGIKVNDNFFELGGHSLLALQLIDEMYRYTGILYSQTALFEHPTITRLIESKGKEARKAASAVKLNDAVQGEPIFCLCGVQIYKKLADEFRNSNPIYGVYAKEEIALINHQQDGPVQVDISLDRLVDAYTDVIVRMGPASIKLVGLSFGGLMALEVEKRLKAKGILVTSVVLLDTYIRESFRKSYFRVLKGYCMKIYKDGLLNFLRSVARRLQGKARKWVASAPGKLNMPKKEIREKVYDALAMEFDSKNKLFDTDILLVKALNHDMGPGVVLFDDYGLSKLVTGNITIRDVPSGHIEIMQGEAAKSAFIHIKNYLDQGG